MDVESESYPRAAVTETTDEPRARAETDDRATPAHDRCVIHPARAAVARCSACDEPVCLACAVPVRGRVVGPECLAAELGDPALTVPPEPAEPASVWAAVAGAVLALIGTAGPWTRTGAGDRLFGAWVPSVRWSMVAAVASVALLPAAWWLRGHGARRPTVTATLLAIAVLVASALAIAFPPTFQAASWGPWMTAVGGAITAASTIKNLLAERDPTQGV